MWMKSEDVYKAGAQYVYARALEYSNIRALFIDKYRDKQKFNWRRLRFEYPSEEEAKNALFRTYEGDEMRYKLENIYEDMKDMRGIMVSALESNEIISDGTCFVPPEIYEKLIPYMKKGD